MVRALLAAAFVGMLGCTNARIDPPRIALQPFGEIPTEWLDCLATTLGQEHGASIFILAPAELPALAFTDVKSPRYRADSLLRALIRMKPDSAELILGITRRDISTTKHGADGEVLEPASRYSDWGVFGLAYQPGQAAIISSFRLGEAHGLFLQRLRKVCVHEVGHNRGLPHCANENCVMRDAVERLSSIDAEAQALCAQCRQRLR